jgi:hypothetical protein
VPGTKLLRNLLSRFLSRLVFIFYRVGLLLFLNSRFKVNTSFFGNLSLRANHISSLYFLLCSDQRLTKEIYEIFFLLKEIFLSDIWRLWRMVNLRDDISDRFIYRVLLLVDQINKVWPDRLAHFSFFWLLSFCVLGWIGKCIWVLARKQKRTAIRSGFLDLRLFLLMHPFSGIVDVVFECHFRKFFWRFLRFHGFNYFLGDVWLLNDWVSKNIC